jgi:rod shape-determining protein MreD
MRRRTAISNLISVAILVGATLLQTTLSPFVKFNGVHPDLVLVLVIGWGILRGPEEGLVWALVGGLSLDFMSGAPFGIFSLTMLLVAIVIGLIHGRTFGSSIILPLFLTFPLSLLFNGMALFFLTLLGRSIDWTTAFLSVLFPVGMLNIATMLLVFPLLYLLDRWLNPHPLSF